MFIKLLHNKHSSSIPHRNRHTPRYNAPIKSLNSQLPSINKHMTRLSLPSLNMILQNLKRPKYLKSKHSTPSSRQKLTQSMIQPSSFLPNLIHQNKKCRHNSSRPEIILRKSSVNFTNFPFLICLPLHLRILNRTFYYRPSRPFKLIIF